MPIRRGTKTAAMIRSQTIGAVEIVDGTQRRPLSANEAWRRYDVTPRMRIVPIEDTYALWMGATRPMIELRLKTQWRAVCKICVVAMQSNVPVDECDNCEGTTLIRDTDSSFDMWWDQAHKPPPQIPVGHRRRAAIDYLRAERQGQTGEMASVGHRMERDVEIYILEAANAMAGRYDGFLKSAADNYKMVLTRFFMQYLPDVDPDMFNQMMSALLDDRLD